MVIHITASSVATIFALYLVHSRVPFAFAIAVALTILTTVIRIF